MSQINQLDRARIAWKLLGEVARNRGTISYGRLGAMMGVHHRAIRYVLAPIQDYCLETRLPPLTILVVNASGRPGTGFIAHDPNDLDNGFASVWAFDWPSIQNPFDFAEAGLTYSDLMSTLLAHPEDAGNVCVKVKSRGVQQILFRDAVRKAYAWKCAFTGIRFPDALDACHIIPWEYATPQQRLDVRNGLLLNPLHHRLFDKAYITLDSDFRILYCDPASQEREHSWLEAELCIKLHNRRMSLPYFSRLQPLPEYISRHNELVEWDAQ